MICCSINFPTNLLSVIVDFSILLMPTINTNVLVYSLYFRTGYFWLRTVLVFHMNPGKFTFLSVKRILPMIYISEYPNLNMQHSISPPCPHKARLDCLPPAIFRFCCRLLLLSTQQALKASPFTSSIINIICRYGNMHFPTNPSQPVFRLSNSKSDQKVWETK